MVPIPHSWNDTADFIITWLPIVFFGIDRVADLEDHAVHAAGEAGPGRERVVGVGSSWDDIAGLDEAKEELREVVDFLRDRKRFERLGAVVPKGILLHGPPGTGKTLLAKAIASASGANFYSSERLFLRRDVRRARCCAHPQALRGGAQERPCDRLHRRARRGRIGTQGGGGFHREHDQTLNQLLVELDGFSARDEVVVMGASNRLQDLDPALLRPGRFDRQVLGRPAGSPGPRGDPRVHTRDEAARRGRRPRRRSRARPPVSPEPTSRTSATRRRSWRHARTSRRSAQRRVRRRDGAHRRRSAAASRRHRQGEADPRLPRGWARAHVPSHGRRPAGAEGDHRLARRRARLHAQHSRPRIATCTRARSSST